MSLPVLTAWAPTGTDYRLVGRVTGYEELRAEPADADAGTWHMKVRDTPASAKVDGTVLVTVDWDGRRWATGRVTQRRLFTDETTGAGVYEIDGSTGLGLFAGVNCYPDPSLGLSEQPDSGLYSGDAETVIRDLVSENYRDHYGYPVKQGTNLSLGTDVKVRARMTDLMALVRRAASAGGVIVDVGLVDSSAVTADLWCDVRLPADKSAQAVLSRGAGTLKSWSWTDARPALTRALVGGGGTGATRVWERVTTAASDAAALRWGGHVEQFVDAGEVFDSIELEERGTAAVDEAMAAAQSFTVDATTGSSAGVWDRAALGDTVRVQLSDSVSFDDRMRGLRLAVGADGVKVTPVIGNPDGGEPLKRIARLVQRAREDIQHIQTTRERETA